MNKIQLLFTVALAFALGFLVNEYRHWNTTDQGVFPENLRESAPALDASLASQANTSSSLMPPVVTLPQTSLAAQSSASSATQSPLEKAQELIARNDYSQAAQILITLLAAEPANLEATLLLARVYEKQGRHKDAVGLWFRYLNLERDAQKIDAALDYVAQYLVRLARSPGLFGEERAWLMAQLNDLIKLTPKSGELHLQLARMHADTKDTEQAQYHGLMAANQAETRQRAEIFLAGLAQPALNTANEELTVELERYGDQFLVSAQVEGWPIKLLLDTGASISGLASEFVFAHYSLVKSPKPIQLNTASGTVNSFLFMVDTLTLAGVQFDKHMLAQLPMRNQRFDGLLGVDILGRFEFSIDQEQALLYLRKRK